MTNVKSEMDTIKCYLRTADQLISRAIERMKALEEIEETEAQRANIATGDIPTVIGADKDGEGGREILDIHDGVLGSR